MKTTTFLVIDRLNDPADANGVIHSGARDAHDRDYAAVTPSTHFDFTT